MSSKIILCPGSFSENLLKMKENMTNIKFLSFSNYVENANSLQLSVSKFAGTVGLLTRCGKNVILENAEQFVTKNKKFSLSNKMPKGNSVSYYILSPSDNNPDNFNKILCMKLSGWKQITESEIYDLFDPSNLNQMDNTCVFAPVKVTSGLITKFSVNGINYTGHCTFSYGTEIDSYESLVNFKTDLKQFYGKYKGVVIDLNIDNNQNCGHVVYIPDICSELLPRAHITVNTTIRSVLSGNIVEKYLEGNTDFTLKQIDNKSKTDNIINISSTTTCDITIDDYYIYII